jgi:predicted DNA binding CopG/RHH family protein
VVVYTYCGENNRIIIRLDGEVIDWFRKQVAQQGGGNYQTMINLAFREYLFTQREPLEEILRRVILEQLEHYL